MYYRCDDKPMISIDNIITSLKQDKNVTPAIATRNKRLLRALTKLNEFVGMKDIKKRMAIYLAHLLQHQGRPPNMLLHTMLCGPPGVGKTQLGICLAEIWAAFGILKTKYQLRDEKDRRMGKTAMPIRISKPRHTRAHPAPNITPLEEFLKIIQENARNGKLEDTRKDKNEIDEKDTKSDKNSDKNKRSEDEITIVMLRWDEESESSMDSGATTSDESGEGTHDETSDESGEGTCDESGPCTPVNEIEDQSFNESNMVVCTSGDFIGKYLGHTEQKTISFLESHSGKTIFIDEFYTMGHNEFGVEALTVINHYMLERTEEYIFICAGYADELTKGPLKKQPGLNRRLDNVFNIKPYTAAELSLVLQGQLKKSSLSFNHKMLLEFMKSNMKAFPGFGGDTLRFVSVIAQIMSVYKFLNKPAEPSLQLLKDALSVFDRSSEEDRIDLINYNFYT